MPWLITLPAEVNSCKVLGHCHCKKSCGKSCKCVIVKPVLSGPHIKRISSTEWTPAWVPKFSSNIYWKLINLHSANTSVKPTRTRHKTCNKRTLQGLFTSESSAQTPVTLFTDVILKLSILFQIDALTNWTLCYEQFSIAQYIRTGLERTPCV